MQVAQPQAQLGAHLRVERAEGLVEQQHLGLNGQGAGEGHALALAARELRGVALAEVGQADQLEQLVDTGFDLGLGTVADLEPEGHVAPHGEVTEGRVVLEAEPDAAAARRRVRQILTLNADDAAVRRVEAGDDAQQRRLATTARAEEGRQRPCGHLERHVVQGDGVAEPLGDGLDLDTHVVALPCQASRLRSVSVRRLKTMRADRQRTTAPT